MSSDKKNSKKPKEPAKLQSVGGEGNKDVKVLKVEVPEGFKTAKQVEKEIQLETDNATLRVLLETILKELKETKLYVEELKKIMRTQNDLVGEFIKEQEGAYSEDEGEGDETQISDEEMIENPKKKKK